MMKTKRAGIFRYRADFRPVLCVVLVLAASLLPFVVEMPLGLLLLYAVFVLYLHSYAPYAQHNHGHLPTFRNAPMNWLYDFMLTQCTGYPTAFWELHHVRGHHRHFLTPERDVARLTDLRTGQVVSRVWYALRGNLTILRDSIRIGLAERREGRKDLLPRLLTEVCVQLVVTAGLLWWKPWMALLFFILPAAAMSWLIWWESYQHHLEVPARDAYDASVTITDWWFNFQAFNIGHHSAHHEKPTLHWSLLPARTALIQARIPAECRQERYHTLASRSLRARGLLEEPQFFERLLGL